MNAVEEEHKEFALRTKTLREHFKGTKADGLWKVVQGQFQENDSNAILSRTTCGFTKNKNWSNILVCISASCFCSLLTFPCQGSLLLGLAWVQIQVNTCIGTILMANKTIGFNINLSQVCFGSAVCTGAYSTATGTDREKNGKEVIKMVFRYF